MPLYVSTMNTDEENRHLRLAVDKLETAAAALQRFVWTGGPQSYQQLAAIELDVRHGMAAVRDIGKARGVIT